MPEAERSGRRSREISRKIVAILKTGGYESVSGGKGKRAKTRKRANWLSGVRNDAGEAGRKGRFRYE